MNKRKIKVIMLLVFLGTMQTVQTVQINAAVTEQSNNSQVEQINNESIHYATGVGKSNPTDIVKFDSVYLANALNDILGQPRGSRITVAQMESFTSLNLFSKDIDVFGGLEYAVNLTDLNIGGNWHANDCSAVGKLPKLTKLNVMSVPVDDGEIDFSNLTKLKELNISQTTLTNVSFLADLKDLEKLYFIAEYGMERNITDISPIANLTHLNTLILQRHAISDITPLEKLVNLKYVDLVDNEIINLNGVEKLTKLESFVASNNQISSTKLLSNLPSLKTLILDYNNLTNMEGLGKLPVIELIKVDNNQISDLSQISTADTLKDLVADNNQISDLRPLSSLPNIIKITMSDNLIKDLNPLVPLKNTLEQLEMSNNLIEDLNPLSGLKNLEYVKLNSNDIKDISPLSGLINLTHIELNSNDIKDIRPLSKTNDSVRIFVNNNQIEDLSSLKKNTEVVQAKDQQVTKDVVSIYNDDNLEYSVYSQNSKPITFDLGKPIEGINNYQKSWDDGNFSGKINLSYNLIKSNEKPVIDGINDVTLNINDTFDPMQGVSATDKEDGDLTSKLTITDNNLDITKVGSYKITYSVTDSDGNKTDGSRNIKVVDNSTTKPSKPGDGGDITPMKPGTGDKDNTLSKTGSNMLVISLSAIAALLLIKKSYKL